MDFQFSPEQEGLRAAARALALREFKPDAYTWEQRGEFPWRNARLLAEHGFTGMTLPVEDGGQGQPLLTAVLALEAIAEICPHSGDCMHVTNFGAIQQISAFAAPGVKRAVLPDLLAAHKTVAIGMSEPGAGSAVTELSTTARVEGNQVVIHGQKVFNSEGPYASYWVVWVRFGTGRDDVGAVLVPEEAPGFSRGASRRFLSGAAHCSLHFDDCRVPLDHILVRDAGFRRMLSIFNIERIGNATRSLALGQAAFHFALTHSLDRHQFGHRLADFQGIQWKLADMKVRLDSARLLIYRAAANAGLHPFGAPDPGETSIAKLCANLAGFEVANEALQILGGYGYVDESPVGYLFRKTRGWMIAGGSVEMQRNTIARQLFRNVDGG